MCDSRKNKECLVSEKSCLKEKKMPRSVGEKMRRDRLNSLLATLAEEVPFIANSYRRLDKTAILRLTVSYMKLYHGLKRKRLHNVLEFDLSSPYTGFFKQAFNGALLITSETGEILFVSPNITEICGHSQRYNERSFHFKNERLTEILQAKTDLIGHNISTVIHPDDLEVFKSQFQDRPRPKCCAAFATFQTDESQEKASNMELLESENFSMYVRLSRAVKRRTESVSPKEYELINLRGHIDKPVERGKSQFDDSGNMWMVAILKSVGSQAVRELSVGMSEFLKNNEWATQHGLDAKMWTVDHRGTLFHGYMPSELLGNTPYLYIIDEDLKYVARSHQLIMKDKEIPSTVFRMKNRYNIDLYIQSRSIVINDRWTKKPKCIVSVNTRLSKDEGIYLLEEQRKRVEKLIAQAEQLALTDTEVKPESSTKTVNSGGKSDKEENLKDIKVMCRSDKLRKAIETCDSGPCSDSASLLIDSTSLSCSSCLGGCVLPSKIPSSVLDNHRNKLDCHCRVSYGVKRSLEGDEMDLDSHEVNENDIIMDSKCGMLCLGDGQSQTESKLLLRQRFSFGKNEISTENCKHEKFLKTKESYPLLKQMLASKSCGPNENNPRNSAQIQDHSHGSNAQIQDHGHGSGAQIQNHGQGSGAEIQDHGQEISAQIEEFGQRNGTQTQDHDQSSGAQIQNQGQGSGAQIQDVSNKDNLAGFGDGLLSDIQHVNNQAICLLPESLSFGDGLQVDQDDCVLSSKIRLKQAQSLVFESGCVSLQSPTVGTSINESSDGEDNLESELMTHKNVLENMQSRLSKTITQGQSVLNTAGYQHNMGRETVLSESEKILY